MIRYRLGVPGSGKTRALLQEIQEECRLNPRGLPIFILAPEQASYNLEKLLLRGGMEATLRVRVLSFRRLQEWLAFHAPGMARPALNEVHRRALLTRLISEARRNRRSPLLRVNGLERSVSALMKEFDEYGVRPEELERWARAAEGANPLLAAKLQEVALIAGEFAAALENRFESPADAAERQQRGILLVEEFQGAALHLDGFDGFSHGEKELLTHLLPRFSSVTVALSIPKDRFQQLEHREPDALSPFYPVEETARWFWESFHLPNAEEGRPSIPLEMAEYHAPAHLPRHIQHLRRVAVGEALPENPDDGDDSVVMAEFATPSEEIRHALGQILKWRRAGWDWNTMAILMREFDTTADVLRHELERLRIPYFLDRPEPLHNETLLLGLESLIHLLLKNGSTDRFGLFVRSRFVDLDPFEKLRFLDYMQATNKSEADLRTWRQWLPVPPRNPDEEQGILDGEASELPFSRELIAARLIVPYLEWRDSALKLRKEKADHSGNLFPVSPFLKLLIQCLKHYAAVQSLANGELPEREEQLLQQVGEVLQSIEEACGGEELAADVLVDLLTDALQHVALPKIPPRLNQVVVAQVERSRLFGIRGAVVLGMVEGNYPRAHGNTTLLTDEERILLEELSGKREPVAPAADRLLAREDFYALRALHCPSEQCVITRAHSTWEGGEATPSPWWLRLQDFCFPTREVFAGEVPELLTLEELAARDAIQPLGLSASHLQKTARLRFHHVQRIARDRNHAELSPKLCAELYPSPLRTSASQFETYGLCPFRFFVQRVLRPARAFADQLELTDLGSYAHALMSRLISKHRDAILHLAPEVLERDAFAELESLKTSYRRKGLLTTALQELQLTLLDASLLPWVVSSIRLFAAMGLKDLRTEESFGYESKPDSRRVTVTLDSPEGMEQELHFRGRMDFLANPQESEGELVIDFKLSERRINWQRVLLGCELQLMLYLLAVRNHRPDEPVAALFLPIFQKSGAAWNAAGTGDEWWRSALQSAALTLTSNPKQPPFTWKSTVEAGTLKSIEEKFVEMLSAHGNAILRGECRVAPRRIGKETACVNCDFKRACRLDYSMNSARAVANITNTRLLESLATQPL
ncbi:MAG: PD-(D/E)XK nuclease family protein [Candidatus Sumerlaeia bacterium]|nr:PD-(D/E)XK nuclease family protein [Candidatus Sumerlaeia bacterium]